MNERLDANEDLLFAQQKGKVIQAGHKPPNAARNRVSSTWVFAWLFLACLSLNFWLLRHFELF